MRALEENMFSYVQRPTDVPQQRPTFGQTDIAGHVYIASHSKGSMKNATLLSMHRHTCVASMALSSSQIKVKSCTAIAV